jgi:hypothetical protein
LMRLSRRVVNAASVGGELSVLLKLVLSKGRAISRCHLNAYAQ